MFSLEEKVIISVTDENFGKEGTIINMEKKEGFKKKYLFYNCTVLVDGVEKIYASFQLNPVIKSETESTKKKTEQKINEEKEEHCINYTTDIELCCPDGHNLTGDNTMSEYTNTAENVAAQVAPVPMNLHKRAGRPVDPNSAFGRAKKIFNSMPQAKRGEVISAFVTELGIKEGSASVYYYNIKKSLKPLI